MQKTKLKIYNSLKGEKEIFTPLNPESVGMYVCGPTVYSNVHLGNARTFTSFDVVYRYLKFLGFKVRYVRNITDVGHLLDNEEDKISKRARIEQLEPMEIVQKYTVDFHNVMALLNAHPPSIEPTATGHIVEQIEIIQDLINKNLAYEQNGSVYFDVHAYNENENYGELSGRKIEDLLQETRVLDGQTEKKNPQDFALWKKAQPEHIMRWKSPWGVGYPGWHLECTVMSTKYLGKTFDIHGGGMDLKFPHHECEIAQAKGSHGKAPANYWMHTNMLTLNGQKMSKSTGNSILPQEFFSGDNTFFSKAFSPMVLRFFMLQAHYRSVLDLSNEAVEASEKGFNRLVSALELVEDLDVSQESSYDFTAWDQRCCNAMNDDFNTPILIAELFEVVKVINQISQKKASISKSDKELLVKRFYAWFYDVLGLKNEKSQDDSKLDAAMKILIGIRNQARADKNWELSDQVRDALAESGILLKDGPDGTDFTLK